MTRKVVLAGGTWARGARGLPLLEELAEAIGGAAIGASRAAVDAGWVPYAMQIGQTGATVKPEVYLAAGISGALQHAVGMKGSRRIVAITKDAEAPILRAGRSRRRGRPLPGAAGAHGGGPPTDRALSAALLVAAVAAAAVLAWRRAAPRIATLRAARADDPDRAGPAGRRGRDASSSRSSDSGSSSSGSCRA